MVFVELSEVAWVALRRLNQQPLIRFGHQGSQTGSPASLT
jgi:hypothetical protein